MTERRPLVNINGTLQEMPVGDALPADLASDVIVNLDGGHPDTNYGGITEIDAGGVA